MCYKKREYGTQPRQSPQPCKISSSTVCYRSDESFCFVASLSYSPGSKTVVFGTEGRPFEHAGIPTVVGGRDEWIRVKSRTSLLRSSIGGLQGDDGSLGVTFRS